MASSEVFGDRVVLVVVTWNSADVLPGLLDSLPQGMAGLDWQLVVADNASRDDTVELVHDRTPSAIVLQSGRNAGYAAAINLAVAHIDAQIPEARAVLAGTIYDRWFSCSSPKWQTRSRSRREAAARPARSILRWWNFCAPSG